MRRLLVTGVHGFVGRTLARTLAASASEWTLVDIPHALDLRDASAADAMVACAAPDAVIHLAAQSHVGEALRDPATTLDVNVKGTLHLLQALSRHRFAGRMLFVGTGDVYGHVREDALPIAETRLPAPRNPYAVSKLAAEALCWQWHVVEGMAIVLARPFNHFGPGQDERFVVSGFARQLVEVKLGRRPPVIDAGDVDVTRDFADVRDVVDAYFSLLDRGEAGEIYNVCSGREEAVRAMLERMATLAGVTVTVRQDPARLRRNEQRRVRGDPSKLHRATGWSASTPLDATLTAMLDDWKTKLDV